MPGTGSPPGALIVPEFLKAPFTGGTSAPPLELLLRLVAAMLLGGVVALIYRKTRPPGEAAPTFTTTLVLLSILIAMVTQVIGDNVARAFSLVGALSIVRFRTVVRDTQDTAYVIFAVATGMAVGASDLWVAVIGIAVVGVAAAVMRPKPSSLPAVTSPFLLRVRVGLGQDPQALLGTTLDAHVRDRRLASMTTAKQGLAIEVAYRVVLLSEASADALVKALNRLEGVQAVTLERIGTDDDIAV